MRHVPLSSKNSSSVIGFGCAPIMGAVGKDKALRAMAIAIEQGINHFDTAPSYGYGEGEKVLGQFLVGRRDKVVVVTKFGVEVAPAAVILRPLKSTVRSLLKIIRRQRQGEGKPRGSAVPGVGKSLHRHVPITAEGLERSVNRSLKRLQTDYLDMLFLHEPSTTIERPDEVFAAATRLKDAGKVLTFGLAALVSDLPAHRAYLNRFDVLQFNCPSDPAEYELIKTERGDLPNVLFSPFRGGASALTPTESLKAIQRDFTNSVILCSMFSEEHIKQNSATG